MAFEKLVVFYRASVGIRGINFWLEGPTVSVFLAFTGFGSAFTQPDEHFATFAVLLDLNITPA